jgi:PAS domain S-box-containing protein
MIDTQLAMLVQQAYPDAGIVVDTSGRVAFWSQGAQSVYGYAPHQAQQRLMTDLIVPGSRADEHLQRIAETVARGRLTYASMRQRDDGSLLYVDVSTALLDTVQGQPALVLFAEKDVTALRVTLDANLMDNRFRDLLESTPDGIVMANQTGHIVIANSQAERLFGYAAGELRGKSVDLLLPARYRQAHVAHRFNFFTQPRKRSMGSGLDLAGLRKDGSEFPIEVSLSPLHTDERAFVMSAIRDISERKHFERALQEKNAELANANEAKDRFLASMSHELRTPLNAIIGFTGTLLMKLPGPLTADQDRQLRVVQSSGRHLLALINDLLDVAKIEAGKFELHPEKVNCAALVHEVVATLLPQAELKGLVITAEVDADMTERMIDSRALKQIVLNLVGNAVKFTEQGAVQVTLRTRSPDGAAALQIVVQDSGIGIASEQQEKLFDAFHRGNALAIRRTEGTGLGLHLSQKLARHLGGHIVCQSVPGRGSTFTLTIPEP